MGSGRQRRALTAPARRPRSSTPVCLCSLRTWKKTLLLQPSGLDAVVEDIAVGAVAGGAVLGALAPWGGRAAGCRGGRCSPRHDLSGRESFSCTRVSHSEVFKRQVTMVAMTSWWGRAAQGGRARESRQPLVFA